MIHLIAAICLPNGRSDLNMSKLSQYIGIANVLPQHGFGIIRNFDLQAACLYSVPYGLIQTASQTGGTRIAHVQDCDLGIVNVVLMFK